MVLYTIIPIENVMDDETAESYNMLEIARGSVKMLVTQTRPGEGRIERIVSSNPYDYLSTGLQPGSSIFLTQEQGSDCYEKQ